jgi:hypothetical protein
MLRTAQLSRRAVVAGVGANPDFSIHLSCPAKAGHPVFTVRASDHWIVRMRGR